VNGSTEWFDIGMYPDACSAHHLTQNTMEGDCLHASSAIVQASLKSSPSTCLDRSQIQPGGPSRRLYVLGDSHATVLMFGVKAAFQDSALIYRRTDDLRGWLRLQSELLFHRAAGTHAQLGLYEL
jgi:hypothetical protein